MSLCRRGSASHEIGRSIHESVPRSTPTVQPTSPVRPIYHLVPRRSTHTRRSTEPCLSKPRMQTQTWAPDSTARINEAQTTERILVLDSAIDDATRATMRIVAITDRLRERADNIFGARQRNEQDSPAHQSPRAPYGVGRVAQRAARLGSRSRTILRAVTFVGRPASPTGAGLPTPDL